LRKEFAGSIVENSSGIWSLMKEFTASMCWEFKWNMVLISKIFLTWF